MADTSRTLVALQALLADNAAEDITPQDLRDFLVSSMGGYGAVYVSGASGSQTGITNTPVACTGFTGQTSDTQATAAFATNNITLDVAGVWKIDFRLSFEGSGGEVYLLNTRCTGSGTVHGGAIAHKVQNNNDVGAAATSAIITGVVAGDVIDVTVETEAAGSSVFDMQNMSIIAVRIG